MPEDVETRVVSVVRDISDQITIISCDSPAKQLALLLKAAEQVAAGLRGSDVAAIACKAAPQLVDIIARRQIDGPAALGAARNGMTGAGRLPEEVMILAVQTLVNQFEPRTVPPQNPGLIARRLSYALMELKGWAVRVIREGTPLLGYPEGRELLVQAAYLLEKGYGLLQWSLVPLWDEGAYGKEVARYQLAQLVQELRDLEASYCTSSQLVPAG